MGHDADAPRLLLFGANGQVGHELSNTLQELGPVTALTRRDVDFQDIVALREAVRWHRPNVVVNAAAYTAVDKAEDEPSLAQDVNVSAVAVLAEEAEALGACMVHYSTDYVFDGRSSVPYRETDEPNPLSEYGRSKLQGERAVIKKCRRHLIFRTSWVFGEHGQNFVKTMLRLAQEKTSLKVVSDQIGSPTSAHRIAAVTSQVIGALSQAPAADRRWGTYHLTANGSTSWHGLAQFSITCAEKNGLKTVITAEDIRAIPTTEYPTKATRPANSILDTSKIREVFGVKLPSWNIDVEQTIEILVNAES